MPIRMRVNKDKNSRCKLCNTPYMYTPEMYDLQLANEVKSVIFTLCKSCNDELFQKTLKAGCIYNAKLKTKEDMQRIRLYQSKFTPDGEKWTTEEIPDVEDDNVVKPKRKRRK